VNLFIFDKIAPFLRDYMARLPKRGRGESTRMARALGISTTLMSQILSGERYLTGEQTFRLARYLGLSDLESDYLSFLVQLERAGSSEFREYWKTKLNEVREKSLKLVNRVKVDKSLSEDEKTVFYSSSIYSCIHVYTSTHASGRTFNEIMERFELPRARLSEILRFLVEAGLCVERDGRYQMGTQKTHLEQGSPHLVRHHTNWRIHAARRSEELTPQELMYTAQVSLSRKDFDLIREKMVGFIKEFLATVHGSPAEDIAAFNFDFFWIKK
jgi:uncharacterized protein (TIGR02147 family)